MDSVFLYYVCMCVPFILKCYIVPFVLFFSREGEWLNVNRSQKAPEGEYLKEDLKDRRSERRNQRGKIVEIFPRLRERPGITLNFLRFFSLSPSYSHSIRIAVNRFCKNVSAKKHEFLLWKAVDRMKKNSWNFLKYPAYKLSKKNKFFNAIDYNKTLMEKIK